jgi:hypothetical protein
LQRFVFGVGSHAAYAGIVGLGVGYAFTRTDRSLAKRLTVAAALFLAGGGLHFLWNSPALGDLDPVGMITMAVAKQLFVIVFFMLVYRYGAVRVRLVPPGSTRRAAGGHRRAGDRRPAHPACAEKGPQEGSQARGPRWTQTRAQAPGQSAAARRHQGREPRS